MQQSDDWQIENLRFTLFFSPSEQHVWQNFWQGFSSEEPEVRVEKPALRQRTEEGSWHDNKLTIALQLDRIDIIFSAKDNEGGLPNAGNFRDFVDVFAQSVISTLTKDQLLSTKRAAFGAALLMPRLDHLNCYEKLSEYLRYVKIDLGSRDFFYQINRPIQSGVCDNRTINRISRWNAIKLALVNLGQNEMTKADPVFAVKMEFDVNTPDDNIFTVADPLGNDCLFSLVELGKAISVNGDEP